MHPPQPPRRTAPTAHELPITRNGRRSQSILALLTLVTLLLSLNTASQCSNTDKGASPRELLLEACRRNNTDLLNDLFSQFASPADLATFLNTATDALGCGALHIAAQYGAYDVLDVLLDQEGVEIDTVEKRDGDTCLHKAVRFVNGLDKGEWESGTAVVEILLDAGCDPRYV